ncbi:unnamed protein product [Sympodiomycopsis kandeliae]
MDPPLDPPLRLTFLHPGRTLTHAETANVLTNFINKRNSEQGASNSSGGEDSADKTSASSDVITAPLVRLCNAIKEENRL